MLYLRLSAADITLSLLSRGPASQQSRNLAVNFREVVHSVLTRNTDVAKALAVRDMYAEGCRAAVLYRGGSASQSEITIGPTSPSTGRGSRRHHAGPWRGRCLRHRALDATRAPRFGRRLKPPALRSRDADENSCSHAENLNCLGRFGTRRFDSDR
jgi:hypothetical protein